MARCNKRIAVGVVIAALILTFATVGYGLNSSSKNITSVLVVSDSLNKAQYPKSVYVTDTTDILSYCCLLVFIVLSLCGSFTLLCKILKYEHGMKCKILDVQKEIYREELMWELTKKKKEWELNNKSTENEQNLKYKYNELKFETQKFNDLEKRRQQLQFEHKVKLKELEIEQTKQNNQSKLKKEELQQRNNTSDTKL